MVDGDREREMGITYGSGLQPYTIKTRTWGKIWMLSLYIIIKCISTYSVKTKQFVNIFLFV